MTTTTMVAELQRLVDSSNQEQDNNSDGDDIGYLSLESKPSNSSRASAGRKV